MRKIRMCRFAGGLALAVMLTACTQTTGTQKAPQETKEIAEEANEADETGTGNVTDAQWVEKAQKAGIQEGALTLIDRIISADIDYGFPSAQLAIVKGGELVYENSWGNVQTYDEKGKKVKSKPVTSETLYDLASNTKMYSVNYAIQYLVTKGQLSLDSRIVDILGEEFSTDTILIDYEGYDKVSLETNKKWKAKLTIRNLLRHEGGFPPGPHYYNDRYDHATQDYNSDKGNVLYAGTGADEKTRKETLRLLCKTPLMYEPGSQTLYSDVDYMVLCYCLEKITGKPLDEFMEETFYRPMGLAHITYNPLKHGFQKEDCAATELMGNTRDGRLSYTGIRTETIQGEVHDPNAYYCMNGVSGHAGLFASASDLAKLASVMLTGEYDGKQYFSGEVIEQFTKPETGKDDTYGLGWWRMAERLKCSCFGEKTIPEAYGHLGFTGTITVIDPEKNLVVVLLTNKIHTPMLQDDETLSRWGGLYYTTPVAGIIPQIIETGLNEKTFGKGVWEDLIKTMALDAQKQLKEDGVMDKNHPRMRAYQSLLSVKKQYKQ